MAITNEQTARMVGRSMALRGVSRSEVLRAREIPSMYLGIVLQAFDRVATSSNR